MMVRAAEPQLSIPDRGQTRPTASSEPVSSCPAPFQNPNSYDNKLLSQAPALATEKGANSTIRRRRVCPGKWKYIFSFVKSVGRNKVPCKKCSILQKFVVFFCNGVAVRMIHFQKRRVAGESASVCHDSDYLGGRGGRGWEMFPIIRRSGGVLLLPPPG